MIGKTDKSAWQNGQLAIAMDSLAEPTTPSATAVSKHTGWSDPSVVSRSLRQSIL
jgi:hypothetical protein